MLHCFQKYCNSFKIWLIVVMACCADGHLLAPNGQSYVCVRESSLWSSTLCSRQCDVCVVQQKRVVRMPLGPTHCSQHHITEFPSTANTFGRNAGLFKLKACQWMPEASSRSLSLSLCRTPDGLRVRESYVSMVIVCLIHKIKLCLTNLLICTLWKDP